MTDEQLSEITATLASARVMVAALNKQTNDLATALATFRNIENADAVLRQREAAVLAREDRCTIREREIEQASKRI